ncbi:hypothetical protein HanRHA438_Chr07g0323631 [Helianthus annuus]|nr:hypothetical protein HanRHA438_Chr07g0323631 [Helianthus annuus]
MVMLKLKKKSMRTIRANSIKKKLNRVSISRLSSQSILFVLLVVFVLQQVTCSN